MSGANRAKVPLSTSRVFRLRALTPMIVAPASSARPTSSASCTSTSGVIPRERVRSMRLTRAFCSSAATMSRTTSAPCARASHN